MCTGRRIAESHVTIQGRRVRRSQVLHRSVIRGFCRNRFTQAEAKYGLRFFLFGIPRSIDGQHPRGSADTLKAMRMAIDDLGNRYERIQVPWGSIKRLRRREKEWPLRGDGLGKLGLDAPRPIPLIPRIS